MKNVIEITAQCKQLLACSDIPTQYKSMLNENYDSIEKHLHADSFAVKKLEFLAKDHFQNMLQEAQLLHDCPSAGYAFANLLHRSIAIVQLIGQGASTEN